MTYIPIKQLKRPVNIHVKFILLHRYFCTLPIPKYTKMSFISCSNFIFYIFFSLFSFVVFRFTGCIHFWSQHTIFSLILDTFGKFLIKSSISSWFLKYMYNAPIMTICMYVNVNFCILFSYKIKLPTKKHQVLRCHT